jgi:hypothetical protein
MNIPVFKPLIFPHVQNIHPNKTQTSFLEHSIPKPLKSWVKEGNQVTKHFSFVKGGGYA